MKRNGVVSTVLFSFCMAMLTACGSEDGKSTDAAAPAATTSAVTSEAPAAPAADSADDEKLCTEADKAGEAMKNDLLAAMKDAAAKGESEPSVEDAKELLATFEATVAPLVASAGDSAVGAALTALATETGKAAAAADPFTAAQDPAFEQAGTDFTAACKAAGVTVNF
ncbi:hypothetical protein [Actinoplanes sp. NPDC051851]|uniref:hypothetical protein n=1 Tax=Actinoplanes sp. NPDC051851 TaxID=3154753 RepID=UPI00341AFEFC